MWFQNSTPETVREYVARQESRNASKRKAAHGSVMEPSTKKQKFLHGFVPPAPAQPQADATTQNRPINERPKLVEASRLLAQAQPHEMTNSGPWTEKQKSDHCSVSPAQDHDMANHGLTIQNLELDHGSLPSAPAPAPAHDTTDLGPATKKQKLSYASLPPARVPKRISSVDRARAETLLFRRMLGRWCKAYGFDCQSLDQSRISDTLLMSPDFDVHRYFANESLNFRPYACRPPEPDVHPFANSSAENLTVKSSRLDVHCVPEQKPRDFSDHSTPSNTAAQARPISGEASVHYTPAQGPISRGRPGSVYETSHHPPIQSTNAEASFATGGNPKEVCLPLSDEASTSLSAIIAIYRSPYCSSVDPNLRCSSTPAISDQIASVGSDRDMGDDDAAVSSDQIAPLAPDSGLRDDTTPASSSQISSVEPARNKGGRPKGRKSRAPKIPKGPTRFQKNHPVKARVNIDVWENILLFCPPDFLLKARTISSTFRSVLSDDSLIWKRARVNHFGPDMPDPPSGLSEPQYADLLTSTGCQTRGCESKKTRKTYWAFQKRLCIECFQKSFLPPRALGRVFKELETSETPQYRLIAQYYQGMDEFLPGMKFDRWDNYQWLGSYDPTPSWGQLHRSGQYTAYPAAAYANFSSELALFVGNEYDVECGRFSSNEPMPGKTCPPQDAIDAWFEEKRAANDALVPKLQAVENWHESHKRNNQKVGKDLRKDRESFYEAQAELAGLNSSVLQHFKSYQAAIAISKPASKQSWNILQPKLMAEFEATKKLLAEREGAKQVQDVNAMVRRYGV